MTATGVRFSIAAHAAWAPGLETHEAWLAWAAHPFVIEGDGVPGVRAMPALLRRRAGFWAKMSLEVAYACIGNRTGVPSVFCSRHGDVVRSVALLQDLVHAEPMSPTEFGMSVHNATGGLFSIARGDHTHQLALSGGQSTVEYGVIEACSLMADGAAEVLLVVADVQLPQLYRAFDDEKGQPYAWAWLLRPAMGNDVIHLTWEGDTPVLAEGRCTEQAPGGLDVLRFYLRADQTLIRRCDARRWSWSRNG